MSRVDTQAGAATDVIRRLEGFSSVAEAGAGRRERQRFFDGPAGRLFATVVEPTGNQRDVGFVFCHSYAWEQYELYPLELMGARAAATAGFPAVTVQCHGYNDAGGDFTDVSPAGMVADVSAAAALLRESTDVASVVPIGVSFGAGIALLAALASDAPAVVLWNPAEPGRFVDGLLRAISVSSILGPSDEDGGDPDAETTPLRIGLEDLKATLAAGETIDLLGYPLTPAFNEACHQIDLSRQIAEAAAVPRAAAVITVDPLSGRPAKRLGEALTARGCEVTIEQAEGPGRREFASSIPKGGHLATSATLFDDIINRTLAWAKGAL